jgi:hypothetical protein
MAGKFNEIGNSGLLRSAGYVYEEFITELRFPRAAKIYKEMSSNDPTIGAILYMAEQLVRKATWRVKAGGTSSVDLLAKQFLEDCMEDMSITWNDMISEILSMMVYGFSWNEIVFKKRSGHFGKYKSKFHDGKIGWARIASRSQESLSEWVFNEETGSIVAMVQQSVSDAQQHVIPIEKSLLFRTKIARDNPEGRSLLRNAYRPWYFKKHIEEIEGIGIERDLAGLPMLEAPEDINIWDEADEEMMKMRSTALELVTSIRRDKNEGVLLPAGWKLTLLSTGSKRQFDTNAILNRYDQRIAITMLADIVMLGADKVGSFALANVKKSLLATSLETILDSIASVFNRYAIPQLFAFNYGFEGMTALPTLEHGEVEVPELNELAEYIKALTGAGFNLTDDIDLENYLREIASMPKRDPDKPNNNVDPNSKVDPKVTPKVTEVTPKE